MNRILIATLTALFLRNAVYASLPPISCDSTGTNSPVRVEWVGDYCFKTSYVGPSEDCSGTCCDSDVFRVDFGVRPECAKNIEDISVVPEEPGDVEDSFVLMKWDDRGMLSLANIWEGYTYCFSMTFEAGGDSCDISRFSDACGQRACEYRIVNTFADCCPTFELSNNEPPMPPAPNVPDAPPVPDMPQAPPPQFFDDYPGFPYCKCMNRESHYMIQYEGYNLADEECFLIWTRDQCGDPSSPCCSFDINKVELAIPNECLSSVAYARVNGSIRSTTQSWGQGRTRDRAVFKVTNLDRHLDVMNSPGQSIEVCLKMRQNAPCNSVKQFCGGMGRCTYSIFEREKAPGYCCVTGNIPISA
jgi:hypothetical protein